MLASATNQNNTTAKDALTQSQWMNWCRLCAKEDNKNNTNILCQNEDEHSEYGSKKSSIQEALAKYFWIQTSSEDSLPKMLCSDCSSLISSLIIFDERVERVQIMYHYLSHFNNKSCDLNSIRLKYNVVEQERNQWFSNFTCAKDLYVDTKCHVLEAPETLQLFESDKHNPESLQLSEGDKQLSESDKHFPESLQLSEGDKNLEVNIEPENGINLQSLDRKDHAEEDDNNDVEGEEILSDNNLNDSYQEHNEFPFDSKGEKEVVDISSEEKSYTNALKTDKVSFLLKPGRGKKGKKVKELKQNRSRRSYVFIQNFEMEITCKECDVNFTKYVAYRDHLQQIHNEQMHNKHWPCPTCHKILSSKNLLKNHILLHGPVEVSKPFKCAECDNRFTSDCELKRHVRVRHKHEKRYVCEECGLRFSDTSNMREHIVIHHTDLAPYECEVCKKRFKIKTRLKSHMDIHSPNKHMCKICGLQLNSRATLKQHMVVHSNQAQHKCDYCGKGFKRSDTLKNHLLIHTGLKLYSCDFCERSFSNRSTCRFHMTKKHPDELAAVDASGSKAHTKNVPKLKILKAITKAGDNLTPVRPRLNNGTKPKKLKKNEGNPSKSRQKSSKHLTTKKPSMAVSSSSTPLE